MNLIDTKLGDHVLDLACGAGVEAFIAAKQVGEEGTVTAIDATERMLDAARTKLDSYPALSTRIAFVRHDVVDLFKCPQVATESFDLILCSNAFVLLENPANVLSHWRRYLKPDGQMIIDIPHEKNFRAGLIMEQVAQSLGVHYPSDRSWIKSSASFRDMLVKHGFVVERVEVLEKQVGKGSTFFDVSQAREQFDFITSIPLTEVTITEEFQTKAWPLFKDRWEAAAENGKIEESNTLYVYIARRI